MQSLKSTSGLVGGSWFKRLLFGIGVGEANVFALRRASVFQYQACTDKVKPYVFFEKLQLDDTMYSFFLITQLHIWMCQVRSMNEGQEGRKLRNEVLERFWEDMDRRLKNYDIFRLKERRSILEDLFYHHQCAMVSYDEGLLTDDKTLASALWRTLFSKENVDPEILLLTVKYVRTQLSHIHAIGPREWCLDGKFDWASCPPLVDNSQSSQAKSVSN